MEQNTQFGDFAAIFEQAQLHPTIQGVVTVQMADWAAKDLAKLLRSLEIIAMVSRRE